MAAVAFVRNSNLAGTASASIAITGFDASATNPVLCLVFALNTDAVSVSSIVCSAGLSGTFALIKSQIVSSQNRVELWAAPAPSGTGTMTATLSGAVDFRATLILMSGADQTTPCPTGDAVSAAGATNPLVATAANLTANDATVGGGANTNGGDAPVWSDSTTYNENTGNVNFAGGYRLGTGSVNVNWGVVANDAIVAGRVVAAGAGAGVTYPELERGTNRGSNRGRNTGMAA